MDRRTLATGLAFSALGFGAAQIGNLYREVDDETARAAVDAAWAGGIRYFDTAPHYGLGLSERRLGAALADRPRDEFVLSTKAGRLLVPNPGGRPDPDDMFAVPADVRREWDFSRDGILRSIDASLTRLGLDRIDVVYLHDCDDHVEQASTEAAAALVELREQGVIGAWGTGLNQAELTAEFIRRCDVDVMMLAGRFSLVDSTALREVLPLALERGVGVVAAAVYNSGLLSSDAVAENARFDYRDAPPELVDRARRIAEVCLDHGVSLPAAALAYPLRHPAVVSVVTGMRAADQVRSNLERHEASIPPDLWNQLQDAGLIENPGPQL